VGGPGDALPLRAVLGPQCPRPRGSAGRPRGSQLQDLGARGLSLQALEAEDLWLWTLGLKAYYPRL
jgi:hypothetical protein